MEVVHERCCGLDIHKKLVVACSMRPGSGGQPRKQVRTFGTMSDDLEKLCDWLAEQGVTHVAMESTASYWKPIFNVLEDRFELLLVNAQHMKAVPGRKTNSYHAFSPGSMPSMGSLDRTDLHRGQVDVLAPEVVERSP